MEETKIKQKMKSISLEEENHAALIDLQMELKCRKMNDLITILRTEYINNRK